MAQVVEKVTAFITRHAVGGEELLLFAHPFAGNQIPAGTVEVGETPETAVLREAAEETGLTQLSSPILLAQYEETLLPGQRVIAAATQVYARPDAASFAWATFRRGLTVTARREAAGWTQVEYVEYDQEPDPNFVTYRILGWTPDEALATARRRSFFHLTCVTPTPDRWTTASDNHTFSLFWTRLDRLPPIIPPQNAWLDVFAAYWQHFNRR